jgi:hypothetical protein
MTDDAPLVKPWDMPVTYEPCPHHPHVMLPVANIRGEEHICYECVQLMRKRTYAEQKLQTQPIYEATRNANTRTKG